MSKWPTPAKLLTTLLLAAAVAVTPVPLGLPRAAAEGYPSSGNVELRALRVTNDVVTPEGESDLRAPRVGDRALCTLTVANTHPNPLSRNQADTGVRAILGSLGLDDGEGWGTLRFLDNGRQTSASGTTRSLNWNSGLLYNHTTDAVEVRLTVTQEMLDSATVGGGSFPVSMLRSPGLRVCFRSIAGVAPSEGEAWPDVLPIFEAGQEVPVELEVEVTGNVALTDAGYFVSGTWPDTVYPDGSDQGLYRVPGGVTPLGVDVAPDGTAVVTATVAWDPSYEQTGVTVFVGRRSTDGDGTDLLAADGSVGIYRNMIPHRAEAPTVAVRRVGDTSKPVLDGDTVTFALDFSVPGEDTVGFKVPSPSFNVAMSGYQVGYGTDDDPFSVTWCDDVVAPGETRSIYVSFAASDGHAGPSDGIVNLYTRDERDCHAQTVEASGVALDYDPAPMEADVALRWNTSDSWAWGTGAMFAGERARVDLVVANTGACKVTASSDDFVMVDGTPWHLEGDVSPGYTSTIQFSTYVPLYIAPTQEQVDAGVWTGTVTLSAEGKEPREVSVSIDLARLERWTPRMDRESMTFSVRAGDVVEVPYRVSHVNNVAVDLSGVTGEELDRSVTPTWTGEDPIPGEWETVGDTTLPVSSATDWEDAPTVWVRRIAVTQAMIDGGSFLGDTMHGTVNLARDPAVGISAARVGQGPLSEGDVVEFDVTLTNSGNATLGECPWRDDAGPAIVLDASGETAATVPSDSWAPGETRTFRIPHTVDADDVARGWVELDFSATAACPWDPDTTVSSGTVRVEVPVGLLAVVLPETGGPGIVWGLWGLSALGCSVAARLHGRRRDGR